MGRRSASIVRDTLALRGRCLEAWGLPFQTGVDASSMQDAPLHAWRLLLRAECCALGLGVLLRQRGILPTLPPSIVETIAEAEQRELQRVLAARRVLALLDEAARDIGASVVVLKGGVAASEPGWQPVDLGDVDVEVDPEQGRAYWDALHRRGWRCAPGFEVDYAQMAAHDVFMAIYPPDGGINVDYHQRRARGRSARDDETLDAELRHLHGHTSLFRYSGPGVVRDLLRHSVIIHPYRRGHIRDLVLMVQYLRDVGAADRELLLGELMRDIYATELANQYAQTLAMVGQAPPWDSRATIPFVAAKYDAVLSQRRTRMLPALQALMLISLERPQIRRSRYLGEITNALAFSPNSPLLLTTRHYRRVPRRFAWMVRVLYRVILLAIVGAHGPWLRHRMRALIPLARAGPRSGHSKG